MNRTLMATTVFVAIFTTNVLAQQATSTDGAVQTDSAKSGSVGYFAASAEQILASSVIGKTVYTGADEEGEAVGDVNDVVINAGGGAEALVVGVGGFLGIGEKDVAVNFDRVSLSQKDGERIIVISATKEELQAAPPFDRAPVMDGAVATLPENDAAKSDKQSAEAEPSASTTAEPQTAETIIPETGTTPLMTDPDVDPATLDKNVTAAVPSGELQPVDPALLSAEKLIGTEVKVADDTQIGTIGDVILSADGKLEAYIIDVGGFLGVGAKPVAMNAKSVQVMADASGKMMIYSPFTKEQLEKQPAYDKESYAANSRGMMLSTPAQ